jgi:hypothetical protein
LTSAGRNLLSLLLAAFSMIVSAGRVPFSTKLLG